MLNISIGRIKRIIRELKEIYKDFNLDKNGSVKKEELEAKWDDHIETLKRNLEYLKGIQIVLDFPKELINSSLSTFKLSTTSTSSSSSSSLSSSSSISSSTSASSRSDYEIQESKPNINSSKDITLIGTAKGQKFSMISTIGNRMTLSSASL